MKPELKTAARIGSELITVVATVTRASTHARDASKAERARKNKAPEDAIERACKIAQQAACDAKLAVEQAEAAFEPWVCHGDSQAFLALIKVARLAILKAHFAAQGVRFATERDARRGSAWFKGTEPVQHAAWYCEVEAKRSEEAIDRVISQLWATRCPTLILP